MDLRPFVRTTGQLIGHLMPATAGRLAAELATRPRVRTAHSPAGPDVGGEAVAFRYGLKGVRWGQVGPALLALHGWEGHPLQFRTIAATLAARGFRVFSLTGPGHPSSGSRVAHPGLFADLLYEAAAEVGPVRALIGHSMGAGAAAMAIAEGLAVDRAVLIASPAGFDTVLGRIAADLGLPDTARARFFRQMEKCTGRVLAHARAEHLLPRLELPLLVVHDEHDPLVPYRDAERIVRLAPRAELHTTRGLGHMRILKDAAVALEIASFIGRPGHRDHREQPTLTDTEYAPC